MLHVRRTSRHFSYSMDGNWLNITDSEKHLGIIINHNLKPHCLEARKKANKMVAVVIKRNITYKCKEVVTKLQGCGVGRFFVRLPTPVLKICRESGSRDSLEKYENFFFIGFLIIII